MAVLIKATGQIKLVAPKNGKTFTLKELLSYVGGYPGYIEHLDLGMPYPEGRVPKDSAKDMWLNGEGKFDPQLLTNPVATQIALQSAGIALDDRVMGDVLITWKGETE